MPVTTIAHTVCIQIYTRTHIPKHFIFINRVQMLRKQASLLSCDRLTRSPRGLATASQFIRALEGKRCGLIQRDEQIFSF
jgi:hypothetical protein